MKYEAVFGDQSLFDMAGDYDVLAVLNGKSLFHFNEKELKTLNKSICKYESSTAMRRIIKEQKRWTVEDQKAGIFPDIGCVIQYSSNKERGIVEAVNKEDYQLCIKTDDGLFISYLQDLKPIETPEEKAQREEDEFVSLVESKYNRMPNEISFRAGIRAAYRKLKGGE